MDRVFNFSGGLRMFLEGRPGVFLNADGKKPI